MGLLDVLNGMQNGPRGQPQPSKPGSGGMSKLTMALLGLLAYKAAKSLGSSHQAAPAGGSGRSPSLFPDDTVKAQAPGGGGLGDLLGGLFGGGPGVAKPPAGPGTPAPGSLGGLLGGAAAGSVLTSGLNNLIKDFQNGGQSKAAQSWVGTGANQEISPQNLEAAIGADTLEALARQTGMSKEELLESLSQNLPSFVDHLTPHGRLPTEQEAGRLV